MMQSGIFGSFFYSLFGGVTTVVAAVVLSFHSCHGVSSISRFVSQGKNVSSMKVKSVCVDPFFIMKRRTSLWNNHTAKRTNQRTSPRLDFSVPTWFFWTHQVTVISTWLTQMHQSVIIPTPRPTTNQSSLSVPTCLTSNEPIGDYLLE